MNIVVLAGGRSTEREVSINTGYKVAGALMDRGHNVVIADPYFDIEKPEENGFFGCKSDLEKGLEYIKLNNENVSQAMASNKAFFGRNIMELCSSADIVFLALHGEDGENGKVQAAFDLAGIRYTGSGYLGSALAMDKGLTKQLFYQSAIPTPEGTVVRAGINPIIPEGMGLPMVVKPCCGGSSVGVSIVKTADEYDRALKIALQYETEVIVEQYIQGREFSCGVLGEQALPVIEIAPIGGFYDYEHKYIAGMAEEICPAEVDREIAEKMQEITLNAGKALRLDTYYRADFILDEANDLYCLEVNTLPGMTATSLLPQEAQAVGIGFGDLCEKIIELSIRKYDGGQ